jgi:cytochrome c553
MVARGPGAFALAAALVVGLAATARAGDPAAGRLLAIKCQACHGIDGVSKQPDAPHLAGQPEPYLAAQLAAYRSGARSNELMTTVAKELSDAEIADLAAWYAAIEITATMPPR